MFSKLTYSVLAFSAITSLFACAGADSVDDGDDLSMSEDELQSYAAKIAGTYVDGEGPDATIPPRFERLVLKTDRSFELDLDTGIRCVRAPCPSHQHLVGTYRIGSKNLYLDSNAERPSSSFYGVYPYKLAGSKLTLKSRSNSAWSNTMTKEPGIVPDDVTKLSAKGSGGFVRPGPAGSECGLSLQEYSVDIKTRKFNFTYCSGTIPNAPYKKITGSRTLTTAELAKVVAAYQKVVVTTDAPCGADKPFYSIDISNPRGTKHYVDDFYSCQNAPNTQYVDNISEPFDAYRALLPLR